MKAVVLAGGEGTRLAPYSKKLPKPLMPIGNMPILEILIRQMKLAGVDEVILAVGHMREALQNYFQDGSQLGVMVNYSIEEQPLGTIGPISLIDGLQETFLVTNGDVLTTLNFHALIRTHREAQAAATIAMHRRQIKIDLGVLEINKETKYISGYVEKPKYHYPVSMGIYVFEPRVIGYIPYNQFFDFPELVQKLIDSGERVVGYTFDGYWQDLGNLEDYEQAVSNFTSNEAMFLGGE